MASTSRDSDAVILTEDDIPGAALAGRNDTHDWLKHDQSCMELEVVYNNIITPS